MNVLIGWGSSYVLYAIFTLFRVIVILGFSAFLFYFIFFNGVLHYSLFRHLHAKLIELFIEEWEY